MTALGPLGPLPRRRTAALGAVLLVALLAGTGCSGDSDDSPPAGRPSAAVPVSTASPDPAAAVAWRSGLRPIGEPVVAGSTAVVLVRGRRQGIDVAGLDVATGAVRWREPWSPGEVPTGYGLEPAVVRSDSGQRLVVFQRPPAGRRAGSLLSDPIVAVDPTTGRVRTLDDAVTITTPITECDDGRDVCFGQLTPAGSTPSRIDLDTGRLTVATDGAPDPSIPIGDGGLFAYTRSYGEEEVPQIGLAAHGRVRWEDPVADLFGPGYSIDSGWSFDLDRHDQIVTGSLGHDVPPAVLDRYHAGHTVRIPLSTRQLVSFSVLDGHVLWSGHGLTDCGLDGSAPVRCRLAGAAVDRPGHPATYADVTVTLEGYDRATGRTTWSAPLSGPSATTIARGDPPLTDRAGTWLAAATPDGVERISLADGGRTPVPAGTVFVCRETTTIDYASAEDQPTHRRGGTLDRTCDGAGHPVDGDPSAGSVRAGGVPAGDGIRLLATRTGLTAYRVGR